MTFPRFKSNLSVHTKKEDAPVAVPVATTVKAAAPKPAAKKTTSPPPAAKPAVAPVTTTTKAPVAVKKI
jgi:hypothetical protein